MLAARIALVALAYALGSISFALLEARRAGVDLRTFGSGNAGATNVGRALGKAAGRRVLVLDVLKGFAPTLAARLLFGVDDPWTAGTAVAAVIGHVLPVWHGFRGGKGAATGAGVLLAVEPIAGLAAVVAYVVIKKVTRRASAGSLAGALLGAAVTGAVHGVSWPTAMGAATLLLVVLAHRDNVVRLARGEEPES